MMLDDVGTFMRTFVRTLCEPFIFIHLLHGQIMCRRSQACTELAGGHFKAMGLRLDSRSRHQIKRAKVR